MLINCMISIWQLERYLSTTKQWSDLIKTNINQYVREAEIKILKLT